MAAADVPAVAATGLTKRYSRTTAVDNLTFALKPGEIVALLGPNGAGKTTTFKCILGITDFDGSAEVAGKSVRRHGKEVRRLIGYLPQTPAFDAADTAEAALQFFADLKAVPVAQVETLLKRVNLYDQRLMKVGELSGGMRQRLALAAALLSDPPVLLLDEPTANLDLESRLQFHDMLRDLRSEGKTVALSTHFIESISGLADRFIVLEQGRLVLDISATELVNRGTDNRFLVNLNGTAPAAFLSALAHIGIKRDHISPGETNVEHALARELASRREGGEARR